MLNSSEPVETIQLRDGRRLGFRVLGDPSGVPLFFFHGTPGSRYCLTPDDLIAKEKGIRLILPERPGYGLSDPKPGRTILDWPGDVAELADDMGIEQFHIAGISGGAPYALACGVVLPHRTGTILLLNAAAPWTEKDSAKGMAFANRIGIWTARHTPWLMRPLIRLSARSMTKNPEASIQSLMKQLPDSDKTLLQLPDYKADVIRDMQEAYSESSDGHWSDAILAFRPWGFEFESIKQTVHIWHGEEDTLSPIHNVKRMARRFSDCRTNWLPNVGHLLIEDPQVVAGVRESVLALG